MSTIKLTMPLDEFELMRDRAKRYEEAERRQEEAEQALVQLLGVKGEPVDCAYLHNMNMGDDIYHLTLPAVTVQFRVRDTTPVGDLVGSVPSATKSLITRRARDLQDAAAKALLRVGRKP